MTNRRKADEGQQEQLEKKNRNEQGERGAKRSTDDWQTFAKERKAGTERRAEENKKAKIGQDLDNDAMMEVTVAAGFNE